MCVLWWEHSMNLTYITNFKCTIPHCYLQAQHTSNLPKLLVINNWNFRARTPIPHLPCPWSLTLCSASLLFTILNSSWLESCSITLCEELHLVPRRPTRFIHILTKARFFSYLKPHKYRLYIYAMFSLLFVCGWTLGGVHTLALNDAAKPSNLYISLEDSF